MITPTPRNQLPETWRYPVLALILCVLTAALYWAYSTQYTELDLGWQWLATRLWLQGIDPYSADATFALRPNVTSETASGFPYPFPVVLFTLPLAVLPLPVASTIWGLISLIAVLALPWVTLKRPVPAIALLPFAYFPFWAAMEMAQWAPMLLAFVVLSLYWHDQGRMRLAAAMLPGLMLKPQLGLPLACAVVCYQLMRGVNRQWWEGIAIGMALWWGTSLLVAPTWPLGWLRQLQYYTNEGLNEVKAYSWAGALATPLAAALAWLGWRRRQPALVLTGVLVLGMLVLPMRSFYNQTLFLLPLILLAKPWPRLALFGAILSWGLFALAFVHVEINSAVVLTLYLPPLVLGLLALRHPPEPGIEYN